MKKRTMTILALMMCTMIAVTPVSALASSDSSQQVQAGYEVSDMANNENAVDEELLPENTSVNEQDNAQEADVQEAEVQEADVQEAEVQEAEVQEADVQEENVQAEEAVVPEESAEAAAVTTWTDLQEAINQAATGDVITLGADITAESGNSMLVIPEGKNLIIDMQGHVINRNLTALNNNGHVFQINAGAQLALKNGTVTGGYAYDGGGIYCAGTFYGSNLNICGNKITGENGYYRGAGVYNKGSMSLRNCKLYSNGGNDGGAIYNDSQGDLMLANDTINDNNSVNHGGGGLVNYGDAFLTDSEITNNTAKGAGAGIWSNGTLAVSRCDVSGNTSAAEGGGICVKNGTMDLADSSVTNNTSADGGGIYIATSAAVVNAIRTVDVTGNKSKDHGGGGITNYGSLIADGSLTVTDNHAKSYGGGIWNNGTFSVNGHICIDKNGTEATSCNNLYLKGGKVITVAGPIDSDSKIIVSGEKLPGIFTSGWSENNPSGDLNVIGFEHNMVPVLDNGEVNVTCSYNKRTLNPETMQVEEQMEQVPESLKIFPAQVSEGGWFAVMDSDQISSRIIVPKGKTVNLILADGVDFRLNGIYVKEGGTLNVYGQKADSGMLICQGGNCQAGIGGNYETAHGTINIYGGTVAASGGDYGAGIGMGDECDSSCGAITVYGGTIEARGGAEAAGIGGGNEGRGAKIRIYGGTVNTYGGKYGAGIGAGDDRGLDYVAVYGGKVYAQGGEYGAGIGEGFSADSATSNGIIRIEGGKVEAVGSDGGAGIGGGRANNTKCNIIITGGTVDASGSGGYGGAGIGSGTYEFPDGGGDFRGVIRITGGTVKATGGGDPSFMVYDTGAPGIGGGNLGDMEGSIEILGGDVTAIGKCGAAAIGAGPKDHYTGGDFQGTISIEGGTVHLNNAEGIRDKLDEDNPHLIGAGYDGTDEGRLVLGDKINVWYEGSSPVAKADRVNTCEKFDTRWLNVSE